ncbi:condensation domain-containing protein, partial [Kibdelosporangium lantanae]
YHLGGAARVEGPFDVDRMRAAFQKVIDRHPVLRTGLVLVDDELKQRVATTMPADFTVIDLSGRSPADVDSAVTAFTSLTYVCRPVGGWP